MILIVVDTGPVNYLIQIGHIDLLSTLVDKTVLPSSVRAELLNDAAPTNVRAWAANPPRWVEIHAAKQRSLKPSRCSSSWTSLSATVP